MPQKSTLSPKLPQQEIENIRPFSPSPDKLEPYTPKKIFHTHPINTAKISKFSVASLLVIVALPIILAGSYLYLFAKNQWVSTISFALETAPDASSIPSTDALAFLTPFSRSHDTETALLIAYLSSQNLVQEIDEDLGLSDIWSQKNDPIFSYHAPGSIETLTKFWSRMVYVHENATTGLLTLEARAFSPQDAQNIANLIADHSVNMVNQLAKKRQTEALSYAQRELDLAQSRLSDARVALTKFRAETGLVDPQSDVISETSVLSSLQSQLAETLVELAYLETQSAQLSQHGKDVRVARLNSIQEQSAALRHAIKKERSGFGSGEIQDYPEKLSIYEKLSAELDFARAAWTAAQTSYELARANAAHRRFFLAKFADPTLGQDPIYPKKLTLFALVALGSFLIWSLLMLGITAIRDRV